MIAQTIAILQARMSSSRLPGKVLQDVGGEPMLARVVERARRAKTLSGILVATTTDPSDDPLEAFCRERGYPCFRGSLHDVLDRYYQAARSVQAGLIVRLTADCPVVDPEVIDATVIVISDQLSVISNQSSVNSDQFAEPTTDHCSLLTDYCSNRLPPPWTRTFPIGLDVEVCTFAALERAWKEAGQPFQREHVMPYFYEGIAPEALADDGKPFNIERSTLRQAQGRLLNVKRDLSPRGFCIAQLHHRPDYGHYRWTVDTPADLELIRQVYARFGGRDDFSWYDVLALFEREPELAQINASVQHKTAFDVDNRSTLRQAQGRLLNGLP